MAKNQEVELHVLTFSHEIARTRGFVDASGQRCKMDAVGAVQNVIRPDLPELAKDRQFTINVTDVPITVISDLVLQNVVDKYIYAHGSYIACDLWDHPNLQPGASVTLTWSEIVEWAETESASGGGGAGAIRLKQYNKWVAGKLSAEEKASLSEDDKTWMRARKQAQLEKLTGAGL